MRLLALVAAVLPLVAVCGEAPPQLEANLLSLFGLRQRPRPDRSRAVVPPAMLDLYRRNTMPVNTARSFTHLESAVDLSFPTYHRFRLFFDLKNVPTTERLSSAELHLTRDAAKDPSSGPYLQQVLVHDVLRPGVRHRDDPITRVIDSRQVDVRHNATLLMDVTTAVHRWLKAPSSNHGILVEVLPVKRSSTPSSAHHHHHVRLRRSAGEDAVTWLPKQPVLVTYLDDARHSSSSRRTGGGSDKRSKRAPKYRKEKTFCRREPLYVNFSEVGWDDWIVAPPGYDAYFCRGECPFPLYDHLNSTNHAIVQNLINSMKPKSVPKPCCVPTELQPISMLYLDETEKVVLKNYQDMTVVGCGCR